MTEIGLGVADATAHVQGLIAASSVVLLSDAELIAATGEIEQLGRFVDVLRAQAAGEIDRRSPYCAGADGLSFRLGHRKAVQLIEHLTRVPQAEAARRIGVAKLLARGSAVDPSGVGSARPELASAVLEGEIGVAVAATISRVLDRADRVASDERVRAAEIELVDAAREEPADAVRMQAGVWEAYLDPDGQAPRDEAQHECRAFRLGTQRADGMTPFDGVADPVNAALLREALVAYGSLRAAPRFVGEGEGEGEGEGQDERDFGGDEDLAPVSALRDLRSRGQRDFDILFGLVRAGIGNPSVASAEPVHVDVTVALDDLLSARGVGWIAGLAEPLHASTVQQLRCGGSWVVTVPGSHGEILYRGRTRRAFTRAQRRAMARRDGGCVWPGCTAPVSWCDAHHVVEWADGGLTDIDNGVLLCPAHHRMLHSTAFEIRMIEGVPRLLAPAHLAPHQVWQPMPRHRIDRVLRRRTAA